MTAPVAPPADPWVDLRRHTPARIALGRTGTSLPTAEVLRFAAAHAQARDAVHVPLDGPPLLGALHAHGWTALQVSSRAATRDDYLRRPDLGRRLAPRDVDRVQQLATGSVDLAVVLADGLSAAAAQRHGVPMLRALHAALDHAALRWAPVVVATQARVALADEIGALLNARVALILIG
ncbi:MAG: ethanolamine ammonia-lyase light chain EutC, partial [Burkholderiaceae bacterium]